MGKRLIVLYIMCIAIVFCALPLHAKAEVWGPWLTTQWNQSGYFNDYCPLDPQTGYRSAVGCTATSLGQILNYWEYPSTITLRDSERYLSKGENGSFWIPDTWFTQDYPEFDTLNTQLAAVYYDGDNNEEGYLCFASGIKLEMAYSSAGSGAWRPRVYLDGFGYGSACHVRGWDQETKNNVIKNMKNGWPAHMAVYNADYSSGHSIVIDGYNDQTDEFHVNMGWAGIDDGWYTPPNILDYINVGMVIYDIAPYSGWSQYGADPRNSFSTIYGVPTSAATSSKWQVTSLSNYSFEGIVIGKGNRIYATLSPQDQNQGYHPGLWVINEYGVVESKYYITSEQLNVVYPVQNKQGVVFVATGKGAVYRLNEEDTQLEKTFQDPNSNELNNIKIDDEDYIYVSSDYELHCLNPDGSHKWTFIPPGGRKIYCGLPAIDITKNHIYIGYIDEGQKKPYLGCVNRTNGILKYEQNFGTVSYVSRSTGVASIDSAGIVYVGCDTSLYALIPGAGSFSQKWKKDFNHKMNQAPALNNNGTLYISYWKVVGDNWYYAFGALDTENGSTNWEKTINSPGDYDNILQPYVAANDVVVFSVLREQPGTNHFEVHAYKDEGQSAQSCWIKYFGSNSGGDVAFGPGHTLYIIPKTFGGTLYALSEGDAGDPHGLAMAYTDNLPPESPNILNPADGASNVSTQVMLSWSCSDPDPGQNLKYDLYLGNTTEIMAPLVTGLTNNTYNPSNLTDGTTYIWKVIANDGQAVTEGVTWNFSTETTTTTTTTPTTTTAATSTSTSTTTTEGSTTTTPTTTLPNQDTDGDGVPDQQDDYPLDNSKATVPNAVNGTNDIGIDISANPGTWLTNVEAINSSDAGLNQTNKPSGYSFPYGLISFNVHTANPGDTVQVTLTFSSVPAGSKYYKVDGNGFYEFPGAVINGNTVILTLTDGGQGDSDGLVNGVIVDPGGIAVPDGGGNDNGGGGGSSDGGGSGGCFIDAVLR